MVLSLPKQADPYMTGFSNRRINPGYAITVNCRGFSLADRRHSPGPSQSPPPSAISQPVNSTTRNQ